MVIQCSCDGYFLLQLSRSRLGSASGLGGGQKWFENIVSATMERTQEATSPGPPVLMFASEHDRRKLVDRLEDVARRSVGATSAHNVKEEVLAQ